MLEEDISTCRRRGVVEVFEESVLRKDTLSTFVVQVVGRDGDEHRLGGGW